MAQAWNLSTASLALRGIPVQIRVVAYFKNNTRFKYNLHLYNNPMPKKKRTNIIFAIFKGVYLTAKIISLGTYRLLKKTTETKPKKTKRIKSLPTIDPFKQIHTESGNLQDFENFLINKPSTIGIILGARGTGKSAIGMRLLENIHSQKNRKCYAMGFKDLPKWIKVVENIEEIKNNSLVLIDEGGILFSSRDSMKNANKLLTELLLIARHKDLQILFISQSSANLEINAIRQADYLILKPSSLLQKDFERKKIKEIYTEIEEKFNKHKEVTGITYIYSDKFRGFVTNTLPSFWTTKISKSFRK